MPNVSMPNGDIVAFPDDMPREQIKGLISSKFPDVAKQSAPQEQGFLDRFGGKMYGRLNNLADDVVNYKSDDKFNKITAPELATRWAGTSAGIANDAIGETLYSGYKALPDVAQRGLQIAGESFGATTPGKMLKKGMEKYGEFSQEHPRAARNIDSIANVASFLAAAKSTGEAANKTADVTGKTLTKSGDAIYKSGEKSAKANRSGFVQDLISPKETAKVLNEQATNATEKGWLRQRVVTPDAYTKEVIDTVSKLPVSKRRSLLGNYNVIKNGIAKEANQLMMKLKIRDIPIDAQDIQTALDDSLARLSKNPVLTGDAAATADKVMAGLKKAIANNSSRTNKLAVDSKVGLYMGAGGEATDAMGISARGLLQARKEFDKWVISQKSAEQLFGDRVSAMNLAVNDMRRSLNNLIEEKLPDASLKASLRKQSNLYHALDGLETKVGLEGKNVVSRAVNRAAEGIPGKTPLVKAAAAATGLGTVALSPALSAAGAVGYGGYKALTAPITRKALGKTLSGAGSALRTGGGDVGLTGLGMAGGLGAKAGMENERNALQIPSRTEQGKPPVSAPVELKRDTTVMEPMSYNTNGPSSLFQRVIQQESAGRQFDKNGKPLESVIIDKKTGKRKPGAIGIAQVMPGTAKEAARLAGLPFDEKKYRNDAEYNKALGEAYLNKQLEDFGGNEALALMAYNWGPTATKNWIKKGGDPRRIPKETRNYLSKILNVRNEV